MVMVMGTPEDKAPRPCISNLIWVLSSDPICQFNQLFLNSEAAMLSLLKTKTPIASSHTLIFQIFSLLSYYFSSTTDISLPPQSFLSFPSYHQKYISLLKIFPPSQTSGIWQNN